ncbi:MAG TPA: hypothetical protein EYO85_10735 [Rhodospirillales bacterium]|nr:hypothetical protein [Rhodospirillales bacterium]
MPPDADLQKADLIKKAFAENRNRLGKKTKKQFAGFLTAYFAQVPPQDILGYSPKMLFGLAHSHWQKLAVAALTEEIYGHQLALANQVLYFSRGGKNTEKAVQGWLQKNRVVIEPTEQLLSELWATEINDLSMIAVASRSLRTMTDGGKKRAKPITEPEP